MSFSTLPQPRYERYRALGSCSGHTTATQQQSLEDNPRTIHARQCKGAAAARAVSTAQPASPQGPTQHKVQQKSSNTVSSAAETPIAFRAMHRCKVVLRCTAGQASKCSVGNADMLEPAWPSRDRRTMLAASTPACCRGTHCCQHPTVHTCQHQVPLSHTACITSTSSHCIHRRTHPYTPPHMAQDRYTSVAVHIPVVKPRSTPAAHKQQIAMHQVHPQLQWLLHSAPYRLLSCHYRCLLLRQE